MKRETKQEPGIQWQPSSFMDQTPHWNNKRHCLKANSRARVIQVTLNVPYFSSKKRTQKTVDMQA